MAQTLLSAEGFERTVWDYIEKYYSQGADIKMTALIINLHFDGKVKCSWEELADCLDKFVDKDKLTRKIARDTYARTKQKKPLTIKDFPINDLSSIPCVLWTDCKKVMGEPMYKKFMKWMDGQTCFMLGVFKHDLERFLSGLPVID